MLIENFDWDDGNRTKVTKHGVSVEEIEAVFLGRHQIAGDPNIRRPKHVSGRSGKRMRAGLFSWLLR